MNRLWLLLTGAFTIELGWVVATFFRPRPSSASAARALYVAGPVDRFAPGTVTAFRDGRFYLARLDDGGFLALDRTCTHLGCTVPWNPTSGRFECPCHASSFDIAGEVLSPPAPRPLDLYPIHIENGEVKVDIDEPQRRNGFDASQVTYA